MSPPVIVEAIKKVPASSGSEGIENMMGLNLLGPFILMLCVPAP